MAVFTIQCLQCGRDKQTKYKSVKFCNSQCSGRYFGGVDHVEVDENHKYCSKCLRILHRDCFSDDRNRIDGKQPGCKFCMSLWTRGRSGFSYQQMMRMLERQEWDCYICGLSMRACYEDPRLLGQKNKHTNSISIDHVNPGKKRVVLVHQRCNVSKNNLTYKELVAWCHNVIENEKRKARH